jgi:hypothetical protein
MRRCHEIGCESWVSSERELERAWQSCFWGISEAKVEGISCIALVERSNALTLAWSLTAELEAQTGVQGWSLPRAMQFSG